MNDNLPALKDAIPVPSVLLDTQKFQQLQAVAEVFANSKIVPDHFKKQPNDALIVASMAMECGMNPFFFMAKTYIGPGGKLAIEGQLAIAMVNARGGFDHGLRFVYEGEGEKRSCRAWTKHKGEVVKGPVVSIDIAKKEGWYERNPKWRTIPDLMLQYRAGAWFARGNCPEAIFGMGTREEAEDIGDAIEVTVSPVTADLSASIGKQSEEPPQKPAKRTLAKPPLPEASKNTENETTVESSIVEQMNV